MYILLRYCRFIKGKLLGLVDHFNWAMSYLFCFDIPYLYFPQINHKRKPQQNTTEFGKEIARCLVCITLHNENNTSKDCKSTSMSTSLVYVIRRSVVENRKKTSLWGHHVKIWGNMISSSAFWLEFTRQMKKSHFTLKKMVSSHWSGLSRSCCDCPVNIGRQQLCIILPKKQ